MNVENSRKKIPRSEIKEIENIIIDKVTKLDSNFLIVTCGSYRRGKPDSEYIEILMTNPDFVSDEVDKKTGNTMLDDIIFALERCELITERFSRRGTRFVGACKLDFKYPARKLVIRFVPYDQYYFSMLYYTGSDAFNKEIRAHASRLGFTLTEFALRLTGHTDTPSNPIFVDSEKDIFDVINYPYKRPEERN